MSAAARITASARTVAFRLKPEATRQHVARRT
jgi:hypothetical protein